MFVTIAHFITDFSYKLVTSGSLLPGNGPPQFQASFVLGVTVWYGILLAHKAMDEGGVVTLMRSMPASGADGNRFLEAVKEQLAGLRP